jgi:hypothetical protein
MFYRCQRFTTNQYKVQKRVQIKGAKLNRRHPWSGAPDSVRCTREDSIELASFENLGGRSAIIHRTVRCNTGLSDVPAEQRLLRANDRLQKALNALQCAPARTEVRAGARRHTGQSIGLIRWPHKLELQRSNPNGWVTWLAHRTVSGGAPDCPVRPSIEAIPNGYFGGWGYKYPQPPHIHGIQVFRLQTSYKSYSIQYKTQTKR